jgi:hypothetical protein
MLNQEFVVDEERRCYSFVRPFASTDEHPSLTGAQLDAWFSALHPDSFGALNAGAWTDAHYKVREWSGGGLRGEGAFYALCDGAPICALCGCSIRAPCAT